AASTNTSANTRTTSLSRSTTRTRRQSRSLSRTNASRWSRPTPERPHRSHEKPTRARNTTSAEHSRQPPKGGDLSDRSASSVDRLALDRSHERKPLERDRRRTLYRQLNTQQAALCREFALDPERELSIKVVCECGLADCLTPIEMPLSEFEAVRAVPGWWVVS